MRRAVGYTIGMAGGGVLVLRWKHASGIWVPVTFVRRKPAGYEREGSR